MIPPHVSTKLTARPAVLCRSLFNGRDLKQIEVFESIAFDLLRELRALVIVLVWSICKTDANWVRLYCVPRITAPAVLEQSCLWLKKSLRMFRQENAQV